MGIIIFNMFKNFSAVLMSAVIAGVADAAKTIIMNAPGVKGTEAAIVWIHGASCSPSAYQSIAAEVQS